ncbi:zinc ribbon domain-containing protein, partial [Candidatus Dojkabacteria bacterium]|nr:zinc ribbon domain-containing protein [Candidatus Dojkabacteria bacterium]
MFQKQCQSCGMPIEKGEKSGTESNGEKSTEYCHFCYESGEFKDPNMTLEDMKKVLDET